jgi:phosphatidylserine/phosphatidylglycerophosphate/cardiolipin synthase-like enzyme
MMKTLPKLIRGVAQALLLCAGSMLGCFLARGCGGAPTYVFAQAAAAPAVEVHYSPAEDLEAIDLVELDTAKSAVDISSFAMDDKPVAEELVKLAQRGVVVRIYRDQTQYSGELARGVKGGTNLNALFCGQPNIHVRVKGVVALAHLKAYAVDGKLLREGSANWSPQGLKVQDNSLVMIREPGVVSRFESDFEAIWNRTSNQAVQ